jgi:type I restriction enzyme R subunit
MGPNIQQGPIRTDGEGRFVFERLPGGTLTVIVRAPRFAQRELRVDALADETVFVEVSLKPETKSARKIRVEGLQVTIADEAIFTIDATGQQLSLTEYQAYTRQRVRQHAPTLSDLRGIWVDSNRRRRFLEDLRNVSIHPELLAEVEGNTEADAFDLLAHIAFGAPVRTRGERATAFLNREQAFLRRHRAEAREVILELLDKYRAGGIEQLEPEIFGVSPFREWGGAVKLSRWFEGLDGLRMALKEMRERLYPIWEVKQ